VPHHESHQMAKYALKPALHDPDLCGLMAVP
jgi:hypothetical protein